MQASYLDYEIFEDHVTAIVTPEQYNTYKHLLPAVALHARNRFIQTMQHCRDIHTSATLVQNGKNLPDMNYSRYLSYVCNTVR